MTQLTEVGRGSRHALNRYRTDAHPLRDIFGWESGLRQAENGLMSPADRMPRNVGTTAAVMLSPLVNSLVEAWQYLGIDRTG